MLNLSDKEIDRLSRDAAEFYEPDDSMMSWNRLEQNLSRQIPERPPDSPVSIRPLMWGPAVLLLAGITYFIIKNAGYSKHSTLKDQTENLTRLPAEPSKKGIADLRDNAKTTIPGGAGAGPGAVSTSPASGEKVLSGMKLSPDALSGKTVSQGNAKANDQGEVSANNKSADAAATGNSEKILSSNNPGDRNQHQSGKTSYLNNPDGNIPKEPSSSPADEDSKQNVAEQAMHEAHLPSLVIPADQPVVSGNDSSLRRFAALNTPPKPVLSKSLRINHSLTLAVVMGPDYTNAGGMANDQLSNNLGISLGYYLSSRLSVNTGVSYTTKFYWTNGESFQPRPQNNSSISAYAAFPRIESVNGSSDIYEIPLTLRYDFIQIEKTRLFVSAGLSSYLIRKQEYTYFFHNAGRAYEWQNMDSGHPDYWFSVGNFSAGFEHEISRGFSFQFEPFVRTPFRGMGVGNMKLNSYGILFSMRYSPVLGRSRK